MSWQSRMVDMAETPAEVKEDMAGCPVPGPEYKAPLYPYGLALCLTDRELDKLGLSADCDVGDTLDMKCIAQVTSVSCNETQDGKRCRVELQVTSIGIEGVTDEPEESKDGDDDQPQSKSKRLYASS